MEGRQFRNLSEQFVAVKNFVEISFRDPRLRQSGLNESISSEGGFLIHSDFSNKLVKGFGVSEIWKRCYQIPLGQKFSAIDLPKFHEDSRISGSYLGGVRFYWPEQGDAGTYSNPRFASLHMGLHKCVALIPFTEELAKDAEAFEVVISNAAQAGLNYEIEKKVLRGTGAGEPLGIIDAPATITISKENSQDAKTIGAVNVEKMIERLPSESIYNACWITHTETLPELSKLHTEIGVGGASTPLFRYRSGGEKFHKLAGLDVLFSEHASTLGTKGDLVLADLSQYVAVYKEVKRAVSMYVLFDTDQDLFSLIFRWNGQPAWAKPIEPAQGTTKISPFVILADRS